MIAAPFRLVYRVFRRFTTENYDETAASLSFSTLLGLVPMIAIAIVLLTHFPLASGLSATLEKFLLANLLPDKAGVIIAKYVSQFAHKTNRLTEVGVVLFSVAALMQMLTIEHAFNAIWRVKQKRPILRRLIMHFMTLLLGPLLFGGSMVAITYLASVSFGLIDDPGWLIMMFFKFAPLVFMTALFALLYYFVPNRAVSVWHSIVGGIFSTLGFLLMQYLFSAFIIHFPTYTVVYGAFAAIPIFLSWLYLSWSVVLVGALIVAELPKAGHSST